MEAFVALGSYELLRFGTVIFRFLVQRRPKHSCPSEFKSSIQIGCPAWIRTMDECLQRAVCYHYTTGQTAENITFLPLRVQKKTSPKTPTTPVGGAACRCRKNAACSFANAR